MIRGSYAAVRAADFKLVSGAERILRYKSSPG